MSKPHYKKHNEFIDTEKRLLNFLLVNKDEPQYSIDYTAALNVPLMITLHDSTFNNIQNNQIRIVSNNKLRKNSSRFYDFYVETIIKLENKKPEYEPYLSKKVF